MPEVVQNKDTSRREPHIVWLRRIFGLVRVPIFDLAHPDRALVVIYVETKRRYVVEAFQPSNGVSIWSTEVVNGGYGSPAIAHGQAYVLSNFTDLTALSMEDGSFIWEFKSPTRIRSTINTTDDGLLFSSGSSIYELSHQGTLKRRIDISGVFCFGRVECDLDGRLYTLATHNPDNRESRISLLCIGSDNKVAWNSDVSEGNVASTDTSGVLLVDGKAVVAGMNCICAFNTTNGTELWREPIARNGYRSACTAKAGRVFSTTVEGMIYAHDLTTGQELWTRELSADGIWMSATVTENELLVVSGGYLLHLDQATGETLRTIAVGQSPYSAAVVRGERVLLGAGDPPYHGLLFGFTFERPADEVICEASIPEIHADVGDIVEIALEVRSTKEIRTIHLDGTSLGRDLPYTEPLAHEGGAYTLITRIEPGRGWGSYALPVRITFADDTEMWRTTGIRVYPKTPIPTKHVIEGLENVVQEQPHFSGAACIAAVKNLYGDSVTQEDVREMHDRVLEKAGDYSPFQIWRLIARRAIMTSHKTPDLLPEMTKEGRSAIEQSGE